MPWFLVFGSWFSVHKLGTNRDAGAQIEVLGGTNEAQTEVPLECLINVRYMQLSKCPLDNWAHQVARRARGLDIQKKYKS